MTTDNHPETAVLAWSGGTDAAMALHEARGRDDVRVVELLTTVSAATGRSSIHGVRRELYDRQAAALGLPISYVEIPEDAENDEYARRMARATADYGDRGVDRMAFGDLALEDVRAYREDRLADSDLAGWWPLWGRDTAAHARAILEAGFEATVVCVDGDVLDRSFAGRPFDRALLDDLPGDADPAGENGEFHTFVTDGPPFERPVAVERGETVTRTVAGPDGETTLHYCDLHAQS